MAKPALAAALEDKNALAKDYRSGLERNLAKQLDEAGIDFEYEAEPIRYEVPARTARYIPDFTIKANGIIIEGKGHFGATTYGGRFSNMGKKSTEERQKFALLKEQYPDLDIRFVFSRADKPIYKNSPTSHGKWAEDHGFPWAEKTIPPEWIDELKGKRKRKKQ